MASTLTSPCLLSLLLLLLLLLLSPTLSSLHDAIVSSRATFYGSPDCSGTPSGACGFGEIGRNLNGGDVGAASSLYRNGTGCGACYRVRCTYPQLCNQYGLRVVVTDYGQGDNTDFILSARGFVKLAGPNMAAQLTAYGVVDIEYQRIPCRYPGYNMMIKITEDSKFPDYLALILIYQAGQQDILDVQLWQEDCQEWRGLRRAYGGVWDIVRPPKGPMDLRLLTAGADDGEKWVQLRGAIPADWKAGGAYDSEIQLV